MKEKIIYNGHCEHLDCFDIESSNCVKRYFKILDIYEMDYKIIAVCNESLKLKIQQYNVYEDKFISSYEKTKTFNNVFKDIIKETNIYYNPQKFRWHDSNLSKIEHDVNYLICTRPNILSSIKLEDAIQLLVNNYSLKNNEVYQEFKNLVANNLMELFNYLLSYCKYKKYHLQAQQMIKLIRKSYSWQLRDYYLYHKINEFISILLTKYN